MGSALHKGRGNDLFRPETLDLQHIAAGPLVTMHGCDDRLLAGSGGGLHSLHGFGNGFDHDANYGEGGWAKAG